MARQLFDSFFLSVPFLPSSISSRLSTGQHFHLGNWAVAAARLDRGHVRGCDAPRPLEEVDGSEEGQMTWAGSRAHNKGSNIAVY